MTNLTEYGYPVYPRVEQDVTFPNIPAPETLEAPYTGDITHEWLGGPEGLQPGFNIPGVSPMSPDFWSVFGPLRHQ